ncbi:hypothetical protein B0A50_07662 [Salinomyces thailandicus]|uniref:Uncharacterized protein n=1 Tax=Salinomyces thailandicus TaxID=706561 RepID=A0A4U0TL50_9PEZI|nr:hypothetical protein B0A50_07662 [Salinomyces thailandica]
MAEAEPSDAAAPPRPPIAAATTTSSSTSNIPPSAASRHRVPLRKKSSQTLSPSPHPPGLSRRRSSILSYSSLEDATQSFADSILDPKTGRRGRDADDHEVTHWHSTPLAFAILPALAGLLFKNGSAFVTDALLLGLAAIFMNWSIRLPWDWYYSAQAVRQELVPEVPEDSIPEEGENEAEREGSEHALETGSSGPDADSPTSAQRPNLARTQTKNLPKRSEAAAELRQQELLALLATFLFPAFSAYLLHLIRAQLSRPSTGLVSDYNLSIFLLAAEIRPCRQLIRLIATRTLHLQRAVTGLDSPLSSSTQQDAVLADLTTRIAELETQLSSQPTPQPQQPQSLTPAQQKSDLTDLSATLRKRYDPRLEGLERAVRRYEKRTVALTVATDSHLAQLDARLQDALSLAAVAAQQSRKPGFFTRVWDVFARAIKWLGSTAWSIAVWPFTMTDYLYEKVKGVLLGPSAVSRTQGARRRRGEREYAITDEGGKVRARNSSASLRKAAS